jgi:hypothetical protein
MIYGQKEMKSFYSKVNAETYQSQVDLMLAARTVRELTEKINEAEIQTINRKRRFEEIISRRHPVSTGSISSSVAAANHPDAIDLVFLAISFESMLIHYLFFSFSCRLKNLTISVLKINFVMKSILLSTQNSIRTTFQ